MKGRRKIIDRMLTMTLTLALCAGEFSLTGLKASAEGEKTVTGFGTGAITDPVVPAAATDAWSGSYVYYGKYNDQPVKYRVLDKDSADFGVAGGSVLLDCDSTIKHDSFSDYVPPYGYWINDWDNCKIRSWLNGADFLGSTAVFDQIEKSAIAFSTKAAPAANDGAGRQHKDYTKLSGEKIFLLDYKEVTRPDYGYSDVSGDAKNREKTGEYNDWWLRSKAGESYESCYHSYYAGYIGEDGFLSALTVGDYSGISPAFNLDRSAIMFSSLVSGTSGQPGAEYKLTLKDSGLSVTTDTAAREGNKVVIPYKITDNSTASDPTQVSVVVTDGTWTNKGWSTGAKLLQYAKLDVDTFSNEGSGTFTPAGSISGTWGTDYHVYILAEDVNGKFESDYAGTPVEVKELIEATYKVSFDLNGKEGTAPAPKSVAEGRKVSAPTDVPVIQGYTLEGWYKEAACTNKWDFANDTVTADITLYAKWTPISYTVKYDPNKPAAAVSAVSGTTADSAHTYDVEKELNANGYSLEGYTFSGWNTKADGSGAVYADKASVKNLADTNGAVVTLYAQWKEYTHSALDPVPEVKDDTTQLWLVKGQKFTLQGWSLDDQDKDDLKAYKKLVNIDKKGKVKIKNAGTAVIVKKDESGSVIQSITLNITKPELANKKLKLEAGVADKDTGSVALKDVDNIDVYYYSAAPDVASVDTDGNVKALSKGSAKITAYANGTAYTATVSVKEPGAVKERTLHLSIDGSKSVKLGGIKKTVWEYAEGTTEEEQAVVAIKNAKITAKKAGTVKLVARDAMTSYKMTVKVDDTTITAQHEEDKYDLAKGKGKNKYELTIAAGQKLTLSYADVVQPVIYKSSKPETAFIDENGNIEARGAGKAKFTAKVNGKTITINVNVK